MRIWKILRYFQFIFLLLKLNIEIYIIIYIFIFFFQFKKIYIIWLRIDSKFIMFYLLYSIFW